MILFLDFEVTKYDWLVVINDPQAKQEHVIVNDPDQLTEIYNKHRQSIWCGYNMRGYDQWILKGILCGLNPFDISNFIIKEKKNGAMFSSLMRNMPLIIYDVQTTVRSLKQIEGFMGHDIRETTVSFDIDRRLTSEEIKRMIFYCKNDVHEMIDVWFKTKADFDAHLSIINTFKLPLSYMGKTKAQLTAAVLKCVRQKYNDEWDISFVPTIQLDKYKYVWDWFKNPENYKNGDSLIIYINGVPHSFGLGGIHGAIGTITERISKGRRIKELKATPNRRKGVLIHVDVESYYPALMIVYNLLSRSVTKPELFKEIRDMRLALKKAGKKKEQAPYKIIINAMFGVSGDMYSDAYDPRRNHEVCINGQLLLLDLIEKLDGHCEIIQSNTDGIILQIGESQEEFDIIDDICFAWEKRTGMNLAFDIINEMWQGDVNNYVFRFEDGKIERKGAYVKEQSAIDCDLPIVNRAIVERITNGTPVEQTINECDELVQFQKIYKVAGGYSYATHNGVRLEEKTHRVFASLDWRDGALYKAKNGKNPELFTGCPSSCFIDNSNIEGKTCSGKVDKKWYINLAKKRLREKFAIV